ncbi:hypothetical protein F4678DRAFT_268667 [Xylaria arbuscula]|nr:hypothetical protein F4678DRAFT_268667 [Xylaria arbuscula]
MCVSDNIGRLACPFYKMDPWKFDQCLAYKMSKMSYVKQHLLRYHDEPDYVTAEQKRDIQRANGRKITSESKWYQVWSILFPGAKRPDTPFVEAHYSSEVLSSIQTFYHKSGSPHILEETLLQVENGCTYREAFDGMLQKIKHQVLGKTSEEGVPLPLNDNFEAEDPDWTVSRKSPATDDQKLLPSSSILATMNNKKQVSEHSMIHSLTTFTVQSHSKTPRHLFLDPKILSITPMTHSRVRWGLYLTLTTSRVRPLLHVISTLVLISSNQHQTRETSQKQE